MDRVKQYREHVQSLIRTYSEYPIIGHDAEDQVIFDTERDHYQLMRTGWHDEHRVYGCVMHFDIKDGKIWIQYDGTDFDLANKLVELGVPKEDIVLGFQPPYRRPYSGFGVN